MKPGETRAVLLKIDSAAARWFRVMNDEKLLRIYTEEWNQRDGLTYHRKLARLAWLEIECRGYIRAEYDQTGVVPNEETY